MSFPSAFWIYDGHPKGCFFVQEFVRAERALIPKKRPPEIHPFRESGNVRLDLSNQKYR
jgi:hypothetical protein